MADEDLTDPKAPAPDQPAQPVAKAKRSWRRIAALSVGIVALVAALVAIAPTFIARYILSAELDALGIEHAGVDSLRINPWKGELWIGPVSFGSSAEDRARLGELGLDLNLQALFQRRIAVERLRLRGIDIFVKRTADNEIELNGIPLSRFVAPSDKPDTPAAGESAWQAGIDSVELLESRLLFQPQPQRELEVLVERLALTDFWGWDAGHPGRIELNGRVNDILLEWTGEARPFADTITLSIDSGTTQASVPKLTRFTGSWGLDRNDGTYDVALKHEIELHASGRIEGHTAGEVAVDGVNYALGGRFELGLERALVKTDLRYTYDAEQGLTLGGRLDAELGASNVTLGDETRLAMGRGGLTVSELDLAFANGNALRVAMQPTLEIDQVDFAGPIEISVGSLLDVMVLLQSLSTPQAVSVADTGLSDYATQSVAVPSSKVRIKRLASQIGALELGSQAGQVDLALRANTDLQGVNVTVEGGSIDVASFESALQRLTMKSGGGTLDLAMAGSNALSGIAAQSEPAALKLAELQAGISDAQLQLAAGTVALQLAASSEVKGASAVAYRTDRLPETRFSLGAISAVLDSASIDSRDGAVQWQATGNSTVESLSTDFAGGKEGALKIAQARASDFRASAPLRFAAGEVILDGLDLSLKRSLLQALTGGEQTSAEGGTASGERARAGRPPRVARQGNRVLQAQALLNQQGFDAGPEDGLMGRRTEAAIKAYQQSKGLTIDGKVSDALLAALTARGDVAVPAQPAQPGGLTIQAGLLALTGRPAIRFHDDIVKPPVRLNAVLDTVRVRNFNTEKTAKQTQIELKGVINEFTQVAFDGWVKGIGEDSNLDIKARIDDLQLPALSPYVAQFAGVQIDSGQLDTAAQAKAVDGKLDGAIQLALDDIAFQPRSERDAEQIKAELGVPLETAVGLLSDGDGRIALNLPLSGVVTQPSVDYSEAINAAIGNALLAVFPPTMVASLLSRVAGQAVPTLDPVLFAPGSAALDEKATAYLDKLGKFLVEQPKLRVRVCGLSTASDRKFVAGDSLPSGTETAAPPDPGIPPTGKAPDSGTDQAEASSSAALAETLAELAVERQRVVRRSLLEREGIDVKRVSACRSSFEPDDPGDPRVEISI
jgi:peptidoglycan hydrolase-like protein with peptidoglycan-binding domain